MPADNRNMIPIAFSAIALLLAAIFLAATGLLTPAAAAHVVFACAALPLIAGAMLHFVPVLTRSAAPARAWHFLPWLLQGAGATTVGAVEGWWSRQILPFVAFSVALALIALLLWIVRRARRCLGAPHPGWRWYALALSMLLLGMAAVPAIDGVWGWSARLFHLHVNLFGLIGLAALGTLPVLLPTTLGQADPGAASWLRRWCWPSAGAVVLIAAGHAWSVWLTEAAWLAFVGGLLLLFVTVNLLTHWIGRFGRSLIEDGAAVSLLAALLGWFALLGLLIVHAVALALASQGALPLLTPGSLAIPGFIVVFLLPLISGALSHLLPVWRYPLALPERQCWRRRLTAGGRRRALCWLGAGSLLAAAGFETQASWLQALVVLLAAAALFDFALALIFRARAAKPESD